jgi:hypothetical protein
MAPQFVDFNADGITDIFTATFDGSPWVAYGSKDGFKQPEIIKDKNGKRVILSQFWDYDARKWTKDDRTGGASPGAHCISAVAFDWDNDGDFDLILGEKGRNLFLQINEGSAAEPKFAGVSKPIMIGDKPLDAGDDITAPRLVDWDRDGLIDIVIGTFGDSWGSGPGGQVKWFRNVGKLGAPAFEAAKVLIGPGKKDAKQATAPDAACYVEVADFDGDGDLDLIVGGYSIWKAERSEENRTGQNRKPHLWVYAQKNEKAAGTSR